MNEICMTKRVEKLVWWALSETMPQPPCTLREILETEKIIKELGGDALDNQAKPTQK